MYNYLFAWKFLFWNAWAISSHPELYADIIRALTFEVNLDCQNDVGKHVSREASGLFRIFVPGICIDVSVEMIRNFLAVFLNSYFKMFLISMFSLMKKERKIKEN